MKLTQDFLRLIFPKRCPICRQNIRIENKITCFKCKDSLDTTNFISTKNNTLYHLLSPRMDIQHAVCSFVYRKGNAVQQVFHAFKYKNKKQIGTALTAVLIKDLTRLNLNNRLIDCIVSVPMSAEKIKKRGFNPVEEISKQIAKDLDIPIKKFVLRKPGIRSQKSASFVDRWANVRNQYVYSGLESTGLRSCLLVDDVVTSGATIEACYHVLKQIGFTEISVCSLAITEQ